MSSATQIKIRKYSARVFARGTMPCPHCREKMKKAVESCPRCGFDLAYCQESFPFAAPPLALLIDPARELPAGLGDEISPAYRKFLKRFPQIEFSFCFVRLQPGVEIQEFAFWLHNSAPDDGEDRGWKILVVTDFTSGQLSLAPGYAIEPFMRNDPWEGILQELAVCFAEERWKEGLTGFLKDAGEVLEAAWSVAQERQVACSSDREESDGKEPTP